MENNELLRIAELRKYEEQLKGQGYSLIAGVDEAGRGPLAGDVFAAAVILPDDAVIEGINDSKKLSEKKREQLFEIITKIAVSYGVGRVSAEDIDRINILKATHLAMNKAVAALSVTPDYVIIDGNSISGMEIKHETIIKGDARSCSIAAASIIAKVSRDRYIKELDGKYPEYGFAKHKGYGTREHTEAILKYGPCEIHRKTFLKKLLGE